MREASDVMRRGLRPGERFYWPETDRLVEVLRVNDCGAYVRFVTGERREFETAEGQTVEFEAPGRAFVISRRACVEVE